MYNYNNDYTLLSVIKIFNTELFAIDYYLLINVV